MYGYNWDNILSANGPVDEPGSLFVLARRFGEGRNYRQAAQFLKRSIELGPEYAEARLALPHMLVNAGFPDQALKAVAQTREHLLSRPSSIAEKLLLAESEAWAYARKNEVATAEKILNDTIKEYPLRSTPYSTLAEIYRINGRHADAIELLDRQLKLQPEQADALVHAGALRMELQKFDDAIPFLDRALKLRPTSRRQARRRAAGLRSSRTHSPTAASGDLLRPRRNRRSKEAIQRGHPLLRSVPEDRPSQCAGNRHHPQEGSDPQVHVSPSPSFTITSSG